MALTLSVFGQAVDIATPKPPVEFHRLNGKIVVSEANVYSEPNDKSKIINSFSKGMIVTVVDGPLLASWRKVRAAGKEGWVKTTDITVTLDESMEAESLRMLLQNWRRSNWVNEIH